MRIEGGSQGGDNLEILGGGQSVFFNSQRGDIFFPQGGPDPDTSLPPVPPVPSPKIMYETGALKKWIMVAKKALHLEQGAIRSHISTIYIVVRILAHFRLLFTIRKS